MDKISIEVLEDGTISVETDKISGANHYSAEKFLKGIQSHFAKRETKKKNKYATAHVHEDGTVHTH